MRNFAVMLLLSASLFAQAVGEVKVWANTTSGIYHCPDSTRYGQQNKLHTYVEMTITEAHAKGYTPARGQECKVK